MFRKIMLNDKVLKAFTNLVKYLKLFEIDYNR